MPLIPSACSAPCLAALLHLSEGRVCALARLKIIKRLRRGEYDLLTSIEGYVTYLRAQIHAQRHSLHAGKPSAEPFAVIIHRLALLLRDATSEEGPC
jgi:hypothetical protein